MREQLLNALNLSNSLPDLADIALILVTALAFGLALRHTFHAYFRVNEPIDGSIPRSFPLICPAVAIIFYLIQTSLPLSLGLLGALSFVRFRTPVKRAEDIGFILILIGGGLACAVKEFSAAILLYLLFAGYGFVRNRLPSFFGEESQAAILSYSSMRNFDSSDLLERIKNVSPLAKLLSQNRHDGITSLVININKLRMDQQNAIIERLKAIDDNARIEFFFPDTQLGGY